MRPDREPAACGDCFRPQDFYWSQDLVGDAVILCQLHHDAAPGWAYDEMGIPLEHPEAVELENEERRRLVRTKRIKVGWRVRRITTPHGVTGGAGVVVSIADDGYAYVRWTTYQVPMQPQDLVVIGVDFANPDAVSQWLAED